MILHADQLLGAAQAIPECDVVIVGAGAAGIVIALELAKSGLRVNLIESGVETFSERIQKLADASGEAESDHPPMLEATRRQIGGTSAIWGGRVVPFDPIDFEDRSWIPNSAWPVAFSEIAPLFGRVCEYLRCGKPVFDIREVPGIAQTSIVPGLPHGEIDTVSLERWSVMNFGVEYAAQLRESDRVRVICGLTCVEVECTPDGRAVSGIRAKTLDGRACTLVAPRYILSCGGLNTTRLLLNSDRVHRGGIGNHSDKLGRYYTGHINGKIAEVRFSTPPAKTIFGFDRDEQGVYLRRRFAFSADYQRKHGLANITSWLVNADISDPAHGNGILSFAYLTLSSPFGRYLASEAIRKSAIKGEIQGSTGAHVWNMLRDLPRTAVFIPTFGYKRYLARRKVPGFFQYSRSNTYMLQFFGEQIPDPENRVTLADETDELGTRRLRIRARYSREDARHVVEAHKHWDDYLRRSGCGQLRYLSDDLEQAVLDQAGDGFHQIGTTRMSERPEDGVVNPDGRVHGIDNLYLASSSTFVTSSQANSMFTILAFALRLADHLRTRTPRAD